MTIKNVLFFMTIAVFAIAACQNKPAESVATTDVSVGTSLAEDELTYELAKQYVKNYEWRAGTVDSGKVGGSGALMKRLPNTRAIWFSKKRLQDLLTALGTEGDGVRFYIASYNNRYDKDFKGHAPDEKYWGYNTLVMVSTKDSLYGKFHPDYYGTPNSNKRSGFIIGNPPENRGEMCPPPHNCDSIGATLFDERVPK